MKIGINYPWLHCGWDFGPEPPGYGPRLLQSELSRDLARLSRSGVRIVRWFVLADGFSYGTGDSAPRRERGRFRFTAAPTLEPTFVEDFAALLSLCAQHGLQLLPVLIDHLFAFPGLARDTEDARTLSLWDRTPRRGVKPALRLLAARERASRLPSGYVKGGRADVLSDPEVTQSFIDRVLSPLLAVSQRHANAVYAWELINEPEWIMRRFPLEPGFRLPRRHVLRFLRHGLSAIRDYGFHATIGFARASTLRGLSGRLPALTLNQLHYYPRGRLARLPHARFENGHPSILGELATRTDALGPWPDLPATQQSIAERLTLARERGYDAALLWSYRARDRATLVDPEMIAAEIERFLRLEEARELRRAPDART